MTKSYDVELRGRMAQEKMWKTTRELRESATAKTEMKEEELDDNSVSDECSCQSLGDQQLWDGVRGDGFVFESWCCCFRVADIADIADIPGGGERAGRCRR